MAATEYYNHSTFPSDHGPGSSAAMRAELELVEAGFGFLPGLAGNGGKAVFINAGGTAQEAVAVTGTGNAVRATSPTLVTPTIGAANFNSVGAYAVTMTFTGATGVTFPTTGTLATVDGNLGTPTLVGTNITGTAAALSIGGNAATATSATSATTATNVAGGSAGTIHYQSGPNATAMLAAGTAGQALQSNGAAPPSYFGMVGMIADFACSAAPTGWLACPTVATNISRTTYAALFAVIGTTWGVGDGSTTFGMPFFPADYASVQANANVGTSTTGAVIAHTHSIGVTSSIQHTDAAGTPSPVLGADTTGSTGGAANLAAGVRLLKCVKI